MVTAMSQNTMTDKWERRTYYGGLWVQNANQAVAYDALAASMLNLERAGWRLVMTVHDEVGAEDPGRGEDSPRVRGLHVAGSGVGPRSPN